MEPECPFCEILRGDAPAQVVADYGDAVVIVPLNPVTPGHVLVIPRVHVESAVQSPEITGYTFARAVQYVVGAEVGDCNMISSVGTAATQTVPHLHVHVVPRSEGDRLQLPWTN